MHDFVNEKNIGFENGFELLFKRLQILLDGSYDVFQPHSRMG